jgi:UDP-glucose 4-epimerase
MNTMTTESYLGKKVLVTGGLGFIGSNLALALWKAGALVKVIDARIAGCGSNEHNLAEAKGEIPVVCAGIEDPVLATAAADREIIFNLAGEISHTESIRRPARDLELNVHAQLQFLETCRKAAPQARVLYASSRQIYGGPKYLPVDEEHPIEPVDFNGVHKWAAENYHRLLSQIYGMETVCLRLTNVYGPRQALDAPQQGFIGTFLTRALRGQEIVVYGDGSQLRDMLHVDDAVQAFLAAGATPMPSGTLHALCNVGGPRPLSLHQIAQAVMWAVNGDDATERVRCAPFPAPHQTIDIASYNASNRRLRDWTGWSPGVEFEDGIARTVAFYREHAAQYLSRAHSAH